MSAAAIYKISYSQGTTLVLTMELSNDDNSLVDFTGFSAEMRIGVKRGSSTVLVNPTTDNTQIVLGGALGTIDIQVSPEIMEVLSPKTYVYDLTLTSPSGIVTRLLEGTVVVNAKV